MPGLETADGTPVDVGPVDADAVNREFSRALADPGPEESAPPKRAKDETPAEPRRGRGRPRKEEKSRTETRAAAVLSDGQRADGVKGIAQLGAGLVMLAGRATKNDAFKADAVTIASSGDQLADACVQVAHADPKFAAALDRVCSAGPYGALIVVAAGMASQIARNHKPDLKIAGTTDPAELLKAQDEQEKAVA